MSDYCNQCARKWGFPEGDFKYQRTDENGHPIFLKEGEGWAELCEGCGPTLVDDDGNCLGDCLEGHEGIFSKGE